MAKPALPNITTSQTFQNWFDKTNDLVDIFRTDAITASALGDQTTGDATLVGDFTATNLIASTLLSSDTIASRTGGQTIQFNSPIQVNGSSATTAIFNYGASGGQVRFTNGSVSWDVGMENSNPANFIIDTGTGANKFQLSTAGTLTVPDAVVTGSLTVGSLSIGGGGSGLSSDDLTEGTTNLFYTDDRARAAFGAGQNINITSGGNIETIDDVQFESVTITDGVATNGFDPSGLGTRWLCTSSGTGLLSETQLELEIGRGTPGGTSAWTKVLLIDGTRFVTEGNLYVNGANGVRSENGIICGSSSDNSKLSIFYGDVAWYEGSTAKARIYENGNIVTVGDITSNGTLSDQRLKENIVPINNALDTVQQINGYTFNYKDNPEQKLPGVIAQEIEKVLPEVVYDVQKEDETYKAVRYSNIVPLLLEAIKELTGKVNDLENRLNNGDNL